MVIPITAENVYKGACTYKCLKYISDVDRREIFKQQWKLKIM